MLDRYILVNREPKSIDDIHIWSMWMADEDNRRVALTELEDGTFISTIFLGLDHNFWAEGPPILFETMIGKEDKLTGATKYTDDQWRYATWDDAMNGHQRAIRKAIAYSVG